MKRSSFAAKAIAAMVVFFASWMGASAHAAEPTAALTNPVSYQESGKVEAIDYSHDVISINDRGYIIPLGTTVHTPRGTVSRNALHIGSHVGFNSELMPAGLTITELWILNGR